MLVQKKKPLESKHVKQMVGLQLVKERVLFTDE
jgi:hypothetical protein